jgi:hypothetical protein
LWQFRHRSQPDKQAESSARTSADGRTKTFGGQCENFDSASFSSRLPVLQKLGLAVASDAVVDKATVTGVLRVGMRRYRLTDADGPPW